jgi:hypothetical protein
VEARWRLVPEDEPVVILTTARSGPRPDVRAPARSYRRGIRSVSSSEVVMSPQPTRLLSPRAVAVFLVLAASCDLLESVISPLTTSTTAADVSAIAAHQGRFVLSVLIGLVATLAYLPGMVGLAATTVPRAPWASRIAAGLALVGLSGWMGIRMGQAVELQGVRDGVPRSTTAGLIDHLGSNPIGSAIVLVFLAGTMLGMIALAVAVWRAGLPKPAAILLVIFPIADTGLESFGVSTFAHALPLVAFGWIAVRLTKGAVEPAVVPALA